MGEFTDDEASYGVKSTKRLNYYSVGVVDYILYFALNIAMVSEDRLTDIIFHAKIGSGTNVAIFANPVFHDINLTFLASRIPNYRRGFLAQIFATIR